MHGLAIRRNTIQCMQAVLEATLSLEIELEPEAAAAADRIMEIDEGTELSPDVVQVHTCMCVYITLCYAVRMAGVWVGGCAMKLTENVYSMHFLLCCCVVVCFCVYAWVVSVFYLSIKVFWSRVLILL